MGCDDALEVEEFVVVGDCIDDPFPGLVHTARHTIGAGQV
jgi:hypothetical protein